MNQRELVQLAIRQCTSCDLGVDVTPVPFRSAVANPTVAVIGHGPGSRDMVKGEPWVGPNGKLAMKLLTEAGLSLRDTVFLNVVCCGDKPAQRHIDACRANWTLQMRACKPRYALVFGAVATSALLPFSVRLSDVRGRWWKLTTGQWAMATAHPSNLLYKDAANLEAQVKRDIASFAEAVLLGDLKAPKVTEQCLLCWRWAEGFIQEIGFCGQHYPKTNRKRGKESKGQLSLFEGQG